MRITIVALVCCAAAVLAACGPAAPVAPCRVNPSKQAAEQLLLRGQQAYAPGRPLTVSATNDEATSLLRIGLDEAQTRSPGPTIPLEDPLLCFDNGKAHVFGMLRLDNNTKVAALISLSVTVSAGKPVFKVEQIQLGPVPVPPTLADEFVAQANRIVADNLTYFTFTDIRFTPGQVSVSGNVRN